MSKPETVRLDAAFVLELEPGERWAVMPGLGVVLIHPTRPVVFVRVRNGRVHVEPVVL